MTVGDLKELLADKPDDMAVLIPLSEIFDGFFFTPCVDSSGVADVTLDGEEQETKSFLIVPNGFWNIEEENETGFYPELN